MKACLQLAVGTDRVQQLTAFCLESRLLASVDECRLLTAVELPHSVSGSFIAFLVYDNKSKRHVQPGCQEKVHKPGKDAFLDPGPATLDRILGLYLYILAYYRKL